MELTLRTVALRGDAARWRALTVAVVVVLVLAGCSIRRSGPTEENSVAQQVQQTRRFDVDLSGPMPGREQLGLASGQTQNTIEVRGDDPVQVTFTLAADRGLTVPSSSVTVATPADYVVDPRHPEQGDDALLPPNEVIATQDVDSAAAAEQVLTAHADVLGLDRADIARWLASAPPEPGPGVPLDKHYFATTRIGYVDVTVAVFISDNAYLNFDVTWDPPIPGYAYDTAGIPRPTVS